MSQDSRNDFFWRIESLVLHESIYTSVSHSTWLLGQIQKQIALVWLPLSHCERGSPLRWKTGWFHWEIVKTEESELPPHNIPPWVKARKTGERALKRRTEENTHGHGADGTGSEHSHEWATRKPGLLHFETSGNFLEVGWSEEHKWISNWSEGKSATKSRNQLKAN